MTAKSKFAAVAALLASLAFHGAVVSRISEPRGGTDTRTGSATLSMRGQSFEDMTTGAIAAAPPAAAPLPNVPVPTALQAIPSTAARPALGAAPAPTPPRIVATPTAAAAPEPALVAAAPVARVTARDVPPAQTPTDLTPRPISRPPAPAPPSDRAAQPAADRDASAGTAQGAASGTSAQPQGDAAAAPGPSAREIARYPQLVNRHLSRLRRPASRSTGTAVVGFTIAANGGLASVSIVTSSGDAEFDALALRHIRGAVPFPAPPSGAQTRFAVSVRGR